MGDISESKRPIYCSVSKPESVKATGVEIETKLRILTPSPYKIRGGVGEKSESMFRATGPNH